MRPFPTLRITAPALDEAHAGQLLVATMDLDSWIGGRALPPEQDKRETWQVETFLDARDLPVDAPMPESVRRVVVPLSQAQALGIDLRRLYEYVAYSCYHTRQTHTLWGRSCCAECWGLGVEIWRARRAAQRPRESAVGLDG